MTLISLFKQIGSVLTQFYNDCINLVSGMDSGCKAILSKTRVTPLGECKENTGLLANLSEDYGDDSIQNTFGSTQEARPKRNI